MFITCAHNCSKTACSYPTTTTLFIKDIYYKNMNILFTYLYTCSGGIILIKNALFNIIHNHYYEYE